MLRVISQLVRNNNPIYNYFDNVCFEVKNLYNYANFLTRQTFIYSSKDNLTTEQQDFIDKMNIIVDMYNSHKLLLFNKSKSKSKNKKETYIPIKYFNSEHKFINYDFCNYIFSHLEELPIYDSNYPNSYRLLSVHVAQQTLKILEKDWKSFFKSISDYKNHPEKYTGKPSLPKYKKKDGRKTAVFSNRTSVCRLVDNTLYFAKTNLTLPCKFTDSSKQEILNHSKLKEVRVIPQGVGYKVEVVYETLKEPKQLSKNNRIIALDLGLSNFVTITNNIGEKPIIINGRLLKSKNKYYNKTLAHLQSELLPNVYSTKRIRKLISWRNNFIDNFMHTASRRVIDYCIEHSIDTIVIGYNKQWKNSINLGKKNNQKFVEIPYWSFIRKLQYKAEDNGIEVILQEESYTSKASFFDNDNIPCFDKNTSISYTFSGKRIKRGLYKTQCRLVQSTSRNESKEGYTVNADVNGSYNILCKYDRQAISGIYDMLREKINYYGHATTLNVI